MAAASQVRHRGNPFDLLGILPSISARSLRSSLETARMEAELGMRTAGGAEVLIGEPSLLSVEDVDACTLALREEGPAFEARLLARWENDPALETWAAAHDRSLDLVEAASSLRLPPFEGVRPWLEFWLPGLIEPMGPLAPAGFDVRSFAASRATEALAAPVEKMPLAQAVALVRQLAAVEPLTAGRLTGKLLGRVESSLLAIDAEVDAAPPGGISRLTGEALTRLLRDAEPLCEFAEARCASCSALVAEDDRYCSCCRGPAHRTMDTDGLDEAVRNSADRVAVRLFNRERFQEALVVLSAALGFVTDEDAHDRLADSHRRVRLGRAQSILPGALNDGERDRAIEALREISQTSDDREELETVRRLMDAIRQGRMLPKDAKQIRRAPPLFQWMGFGFHIVGGHDRDAASGAYSAVYYLTLLFIPFLPLRRYRLASPAEGRYQFFGRLPFRREEYVHMVIALAVAAGVIALIAVNPGEGGAADRGGASTAPRSAPTARPTTTSQSSTYVRGDCVRTSGTYDSVSVRKVSCSTTHDGYVAEVITLSGSTYPRESTIDQRANTSCPRTTDSYIFPSRDTWADGDRQILCIDEDR